MVDKEYPPRPADRTGQPDLSRLQALLRLAGPEDGRELLARLHEDLARAAQDLDHALDAGDAPGLQRVTHVLISVAGSIGDAGLAALARQLNAEVQGGQATPSPGLPDRVREGLRMLRQSLHPFRAQGGPDE